MKAERRHELKTNALARNLESLPEFGRNYGGKILLVLALVLLIIVFLRTRASARRDRIALAGQNLATARDLIDRLKQPSPSNPVAMAAQRRDQADAAMQALDEAQHGTDDPRTIAQVLLSKGDLYYLLATLPQPPAATTRPTELGTQPPPEQALPLAREAYQKVVQDYGNEPMFATSARFGLAAIAVNEHDWTAARELYKQIADSPNLIQAYRQLAQRNLQLLDRIEKPILVATPATQPAAVPMGNLSLGPDFGAIPQMATPGIPSILPTTEPVIPDVPRVTPPATQPVP